eukprot:1095921-Amorphochlora_amoeboformis.AAC.2
MVDENVSPLFEVSERVQLAGTLLEVGVRENPGVGVTDIGRKRSVGSVRSMVALDLLAMPPPPPHVRESVQLPVPLYGGVP